MYLEKHKDIRVGDIVQMNDWSYAMCIEGIMTDIKTAYPQAPKGDNSPLFVVITVGGNFPTNDDENGEAGGPWRNDVMLRQRNGATIVFTRTKYLSLKTRVCKQCGDVKGIRHGDTVMVHDGSNSVKYDHGDPKHSFGCDMVDARFIVVAVDCKLPTEESLYSADQHDVRVNDVIIQEIQGTERTVFITQHQLTLCRRVCTECGKTNHL